jgi:taurine dioxygenase
MHIQKLGPAIGALVTDIDLRQALNSEQQTHLHEALIEHQVLFFEGQDITPLWPTAYSSSLSAAS